MEENREEWVAYWLQRKQTYKEMLLLNTSVSSYDEYLRDLEQLMRQKQEMKTALKWMFVYIVILVIHLILN